MVLEGQAARKGGHLILATKGETEHSVTQFLLSDP
jgi:hypothetical protein